MTIHFPWGSLLRGVLGHDDIALAGIAALLAPGAAVAALVSVIERDGVAGPAENLAARYASQGLALARMRPASPAEVRASGSSWAKRLRAGGAARPVLLLR